MRQPLTLVLAAALSTSVIARQQPTFRAGVDAVRVDVSVTDHGKPVRGLTAQDFVVADNGMPEPVTSVTLEQLPLRVVLLLDTSGSVEGSALTTLVDASDGLVDALRPTDRIAVVTFSGEVTLLGGSTPRVRPYSKRWAMCTRAARRPCMTRCRSPSSWCAWMMRRSRRGR
jgi:VWFA-related protein